MTHRRTARELRELDALAHFHMTSEDALTVPCPQCQAPPGELCANPHTGEPIRAPAHWQRIHRADHLEEPTP